MCQYFEKCKDMHGYEIKLEPKNMGFEELIL
jgi:hypothetical protein